LLHLIVCHPLFFLCLGPRYPDKAKASYAPVPYDGPPQEPTRLPHQEWDFHAQGMYHRNFMASRPPPECAIPVSNRGALIFQEILSSLKIKPILPFSQHYKNY